jgi:hypothetical protein
MNRLIAALCLMFLPCAAMAQQGTPVSPAPSDLQGSTGVCATAPVVNATQAAGTCTISVPANQHLYINFLQVGACVDDTTNLTNTPQLAFTSTNLNGWTQQFSVLMGGTVGTTGAYQACIFMGGPRGHPLVSAAGPVSVTILPPAQQAHTSYPINVEYYLAQ